MEHVTYFEITSNEMFAHYMHKRQTLTVEECIKSIYVLLSPIIYTFVFIFSILHYLYSVMFCLLNDY